MKKLKYITFIGIVALLSSCSLGGPVVQPKALITKNEGTKVGVAERTIWFGIAFGHTDLGILAAAKKGKIKKIASVDSQIEASFFRTTYRTIVTGE